VSKEESHLQLLVETWAGMTFVTPDIVNMLSESFHAASGAIFLVPKPSTEIARLDGSGYMSNRLHQFAGAATASPSILADGLCDILFVKSHPLIVQLIPWTSAVSQIRVGFAMRRKI
jgi:hypothetical protein